jgi:nucleoside phosphorylase
MLERAHEFPRTCTHGFTTRVGGVSQGRFASLNLGERWGDEPEAVVENLRPRAILVAGAAGGNSGRTAIGRVHLVDRAFHHDRRIPLPGFDAYGIGPEPLHHSSELAEAFGVGIATISTGNALDTLADELAFFERHGVTLKDMETASIAWTAGHAGTRVLALRAVTDFFDHPTPEHQFLANFDAAVTGLAAAVVRGLPALLDACASDAWA